MAIRTIILITRNWSGLSQKQQQAQQVGQAAHMVPAVQPTGRQVGDWIEMIRTQDQALYYINITDHRTQVEKPEGF